MLPVGVLLLEESIGQLVPLKRACDLLWRSMLSDHLEQFLALFLIHPFSVGYKYSVVAKLEVTERWIREGISAMGINTKAQDVWVHGLLLRR